MRNIKGSDLYTALFKDASSTSYETQTYNFIGTATYIYLAYPSTYPNLISIKDQNNFELLTSFQLTSSAQIVSYGLYNEWTDNYKIYRLSLLADPAGNFTFSF